MNRKTLPREEDLKEEGKVAVNEYVRELGDYIFGEESMVRMFVLGANYADQHPREGLWDSEKVILFLIGAFKELPNGHGTFKLKKECSMDQLIEDLQKTMED